jgi:hypothetical protein
MAFDLLVGKKQFPGAALKENGATSSGFID